VIVVGLTGGVATGKSTVAAMFAARGAAVVDADRLGHALQEPGAACYAPVVTAFGPGVLDERARIDRRRLGALVFADPTARRRLDAIMRPALWDACAAAIREAEAAGFRLCVVEAAILLEANWQKHMRAVVTVAAPKAVQVERLMRSRGLSAADARGRVVALWSTAEKLARADYVIENGGDPAETEAQVDRIVAALFDLQPETEKA
jgi:dephospho-CoA kinase